jgi:hypothetical protein
MFYKSFKHALITALAAISLAMGGCGSRQFGVSGKVMYNNSVLNSPDGVVVFVGPKGEQVEAKINPDGTYQTTGVCEGLNRVVVYYVNPKIKTEKPGRSKSAEEPKTPPPPYLTPAKYTAPDTSGFLVTVDKDTVFNIEMTGPPIP